MRWLVVSSCVLAVARAQAGDAAALGMAATDTAGMAANMQKFADLYGFATQMMNIGGSFIRGQGKSGGSPSSSSSMAAALSPYADFAAPAQSSSSAASSFFPSYSNYGGNGIMSDFASSAGGSSGGYGGGSSGSNGMLARAAQNFLSEYGGLQTASRSQAPTPRGQSGFQSLLNTFLGSSVSEENLPPPPTPRPRPQRSLFEQFLGYGAGTGSGAFKGDEDSLPPPPPPKPQAQQRLMPSFADLLSPSYDSKPSQQLNFLELLGMERPTTTTTRRPIHIFDRSEKYGLAQGASDIDGILNALMRSGARPSAPVEAEQPSSAGLLASFLGK
ncbi:hypothetical protein PFISCL1PPCAC_22596 [Pristionchus fissidentatus]|uniref:Uncharacterized protein n=1 Tax=Pristionchus fissidentatus TaxID=1538716 RepID=A0AAV5WNH4_9BILA|nr:hypothetical protein PFISCL1PPCAC_22596 [Pristionchus fissidentatus]